jgi:hypothetical protein
MSAEFVDEDFGRRPVYLLPLEKREERPTRTSGHSEGKAADDEVDRVRRVVVA